MTTDEYTPLELLAKVLEYEHALEHAAWVSDEYHPTACPSCIVTCQSALDGVNREDFRENARDILAQLAPSALISTERSPDPS